MELEQQVVNAYKEGKPLIFIQESFNISEEAIKKILIDYKVRNRIKRTFTDDFKKLIAERDISDIPRRVIASELNINASTVKHACEQFGQAVKERASSENTYTIVKGVHNLHSCPDCKGKKVNEIESMMGNINTMGIFCMNCHEEFFEFNGKVYRVNWEYID